MGYALFNFAWYGQDVEANNFFDAGMQDVV